MSMRAYARHRGCTLQAVQKAVKTGRIALEGDGKINRGKADKAWALNTKAVACDTAPAVPVPAVPQPESPDVKMSLNEARAVREHYQARIVELEYLERRSELISREALTSALVQIMTILRESMYRVAADGAPQIQAAKDIWDGQRVARRYVDQALADAADAIAALVATPAVGMMTESQQPNDSPVVQ